MAICRNCGQPMADGMNVCPSCGAVQNAAPQAPVAPQAPAAPQAPVAPQAPAAPQAPVAPQAPAAPQAPVAPQAPAYQQPQQPVYPQQPQQPVYPQQPQAPVYPQQTGYSAKEKLDYVPSANSGNMPMMVYVGLAGALLALLASFFSPFSKIYYVIGLLGMLCTGAAMYYIYDSFKKGLVGHKEPMTGLCGATSILVLVSYGLMALSQLVFLLSSNIFSAASNASVFTILGGLASLGYLVCSIIVGIKMLNAYEGKVKMFGILIIAYPVVSFVASLVGGAASARSVFSSGINFGAVFIALVGAGVLGYMYYLAHEVFTGKKLF